MEKIAIIGLACLFPEAETPEQYWQNLIQGKDSTSLASAEEMGVDANIFYDPSKGATDKYYCMRGGYIRDFVFDPSGYHLPAEFLEGLDNMFKWPLYVAKQALQDSGYWGQDAQSGLVLGNLSFPTKYSHRLVAQIYYKTIKAALQELLGQRHFALPRLPDLGNISPLNTMMSGYPSALIAQALSLSGVHFSIDSACATSLYAVKLACDHLLSGQADLMLAGAVSCADPLFIHMGFSIFRAYSSSGVSRPLDQAADGLLSGEGAGMLVLKRYSDAVRDGDKIYATILGIGLSNDGRGQFLLTPNPKGQIRAFERAFADAAIDPQSIDYVECHATGTPLGDKAELGTLDAFFGQHGAPPLLGAVKSNFGHLLTVAGMTGMLKVILSMSHGLIPATINLDAPRHSPNNVITDDHVVGCNTPWPDRGSLEETEPIRRAGVSAFGFGGTNAHIILEKGPTPPQAQGSVTVKKAAPRRDKMAIIGMDAFFGPCHDLHALGHSIYAGKQHLGPLPAGRWKGIDAQKQLLKEHGFVNGEPPLGAYIQDFDVDFLHFKIPPHDADKPIPQQLLMLKVADNALMDAGIDEGGAVAVIIAMGTELALHQFRGRVDLSWQLERALQGEQIDQTNLLELEDLVKNSLYEPAQVNQYTSFIGNIMASRVSSFWDFSGPSFTLSSEENSVFRALKVAQLLLDAGEVEAVVVGAVDLAGGVESVLLRNQMSPVNTGVNTLSYDQNANGWLVGEGAGAVVLKRLDAAQQNQDRIYAVIEAVSIEQSLSDDCPRPPSAKTVKHACQKAFDSAGVTPEDIGYLEVCASGIGQQDEAEIKGLTQAYSSEIPEKSSCALGSIKANIGHTFAAAGMAGLIKTALCVYHRYIPATPAWSGPKAPERWQTSPFYVATESSPWFLKPGADKRVAAVSGLGLDGTCAHLVLSENPRQTASDNLCLTHTPFYLFPIAADDQAALLPGLLDLQQSIENASCLTAAASQNFAAFQNRPQAAYTLSIVGHDKEELVREIQFALKGAPKAFERGDAWQSPLGSYFTAQPLGKQGKIAFVYPGAFNSYPRLGRDVFYLFPELFDRFAQITSNIGRSVADKFLYPQSLNALSSEQLQDYETQLMDNPTAIIESGTSFAVLFTMIMQDIFQVHPQSVFGYSLGEASMMWAMGVWRHGDQASDAWHSTDLFKSRLSGRKDAVREQWDLGQVEEDFWSTYILRAPASQVAERLQTEERVYLAIINDPRETVIAGDSQACLRVIESLGCAHLRAPFNSVIHCAPIHSEYDEFVRLHTYPASQVTGIDFYSADNCKGITLDSETIAHTIARVSCKQIDFPRLVEQIYDDGARIFIELGPLGNCSRWIGRTLGGKAHVAMAINKKGIDDHTSILGVLAKLVSHRVPVDLSPLYERKDESNLGKRSIIKTVTLGGERIASTLVTPENRARFANLLGQPQAAETFSIDKIDALSGNADLPAAADAPALAREVQADQVLPLQAAEPLTTAPDLSFHQKMSMHAALIAGNHLAFLQARGQALKQIGDLVKLQITASQKALGQDFSVLETPLPAAKTGDRLSLLATAPDFEPPQPQFEIVDSIPPRPPSRDDVVWDQADLIEFAQGEIAPVFGQEYAIIDTYHRRVRLPAPPYLLVTRVTRVEGERGVFEPSLITTEYDIPHNAWYTVDGQIPWAVAVESGQCDLLLISYLGIDFENKGGRVYRLLDCTLTFLDDLPHEGQTLRYDISIDSFAQSGKSLLFFFSYECFVGQKMVLKMHGGCAGFFSDEELAGGKGIIITEKELEAKRKIPKRSFDAPLTCSRTAFDQADMLQLGQGDIAACFGAQYAQNGKNPSLRLPPPAILMIDKIVSVDSKGGAWGLGMIVAEKVLEPDHWYFPCHFKDDQVLAGSLVAEGCGQLLQFYLLYLGLQTHTKDARFHPIPDLAQVVRTRRQITACSSVLTYRLEITEIGSTPKPYAKANVDIIFEGRVVVDFKDLGLQLSEKTPQPQKQALFNEYHISEFALGSIPNCFGPDYAIYENRRVPRTPNGDLQLISRILTVDAKRGEFRELSSLVSEYDVPAEPWFYAQNAYPTLPYSICMEIALQPCGFLSAFLGSTLPFPEENFYFRNLDGYGRMLKDVDARGKTIVNRVRLLSSTNIQGIIIQKFDFALICEGVPFYQGEAAFGYFTAQALANQAGLDGGKEIAVWHVQENVAGLTPVSLRAEASRQRLYQPRPDKPHYHLAGTQLDFLDEFVLLAGGGRHGQGYIYASKRINPQDWFFSCHFYQDPVMPGSLGIEAIIQAMQIFALEQDLGKHLKSPRFAQALDQQIVWKYRGQIVPDNENMSLEIHISAIDSSDSQVTIVGEASLWKEGLRIYEIEQMSIRLVEANVR